jgi:hypothetical protein
MQLKKNCDHSKQLRLKSIVSQNWFCWENNAINYAEDFNKEDCVMVLKACAKLKIKPSSEFTTALNDQLSKSRDNLAASDFVPIFKSAATLSISLPTTLNDYFRLQALNVPGFLRRVSKSPILRSCAINDCLNPNQGYDQTAETIRSMLPSRIRNHRVGRQRYHAALWFDWDTAQPRRPDTETVSRTEIKLGNWLKGNHIDINEHVSPISELPQAIDISVVFNQETILTELDGPTHYVNLSLDDPFHIGQHLDGSTLFRSALTAKYAPRETLIRFSTHTSDILTGESDAVKLSGAERLALTHDLFNQVTQSGNQYNLATVENIGGDVIGVKIEPMFSQMY